MLFSIGRLPIGRGMRSRRCYKALNQQKMILLHERRNLSATVSDEENTSEYSHSPSSQHSTLESNPGVPIALQQMQEADKNHNCEQYNHQKQVAEMRIKEEANRTKELTTGSVSSITKVYLSQKIANSDDYDTESDQDDDEVNSIKQEYEQRKESHTERGDILDDIKIMQQTARICKNINQLSNAADHSYTSNTNNNNNGNNNNTTNCNFITIPTRNKDGVVNMV